MNKIERERAVAWTRAELDEIFAFLTWVDANFSPSEIDVLAMVEQLDDLAFSDASWLADAESLGALSEEEELRRAWYAGLAPDGHVASGRGSYVRHLTHMVQLARKDADCFDALRRHAADFAERGDAMPFELRSFVACVLRDDLVRPSRRGSPKSPFYRDILLYALLKDIIARFGVKATRGKGSLDATSACDILAEAMPRRARLPKSYGAIERIFLNGNKVADGILL